MLTQKDSDQLLRFLKDWAKPLQEILDSRFGPGKIAHVIITVDTGNTPTVSYTTNLSGGDFERLLKTLAEHMGARKIIT